MKLSLTFGLYTARLFLLHLLMTFGVFFVLITFIDATEILRRSFNKDVPFWIVVEMVLLKFPMVIQKIAPFLMLIASVMTLTRLTRHQELVIARSSGISIWQALVPLVFTGILLGIFMVTVINPLACVMIARFQKIENNYLEGNISSFAISTSGLWLRQKNQAADGNNHMPGESIIHAMRAGATETELQDVIIFIYGDDRDTFLRRIDAKRAVLANDFWHLHDVIITAPDKPAIRQDEFFLETDLSIDQIKESFSPPEAISFWELPEFIRTLQDAGFSALKHQMYWHSILISPFFYASMIIIGAVFSLRLPRRGKTNIMMALSVITGFIIYFMTDLISAFGSSGKLPVIIAAWIPVCATMMIGIALLMHQEER